MRQAMKHKYLQIILALAFVLSCKQVYNPPNNSPDTGYLVVEGFISSGASPTSITLSRTVGLNETNAIIYEKNAALNIEGDNNDNFPLEEGVNGEYHSQPLTLNSTAKYRLHIKTGNGKEYVSDYATVKSGPPIDSVSWKREDGGVRIYINTHDPNNNTKYYQWRYEETWEFYSAYQSTLRYTTDAQNVITGVAYRYPNQTADTTIYRCWNTVNSSNINIGSSEKLTSDVIYLPLIYIPGRSIKLSYLYSVNMRQIALSEQAYRFMEKMKKNTEELGSIFDPQPSELQGNIHCVTNPSEIVIGFVEVSDEKQKRIFIRKDQVPDWGYSPSCTTVEIDNIVDSIKKYGSGRIPTIAGKTSPFGSIITFYAADPGCVDCTLSGTNVKPPFWP